MKKLFIVFFQMVFIFLQLPVAGQEEYYLLHHYTNENGLPSNGIRGIEYDSSTGFIWVGTESGLVRFDGLHFIAYSRINDSLNISRVFILDRTMEGNIYFSDDKNSFYYIKGTELKFILSDFQGDQTKLFPYYAAGTPAKEVINAIKKRKVTSILPDNVGFTGDKNYGNVVFENDREQSNFLILYRDSLFLGDIKKDTSIFLCTTRKKSKIVKIRNDNYVISSNGDILKYNPTTQQLSKARFKGFAKDNHEPILYFESGMKEPQEPLYIQNHDLWKLTNGPSGDLTSEIVCRNCIPEDNAINYVSICDELHYIFIGSETNGLYVLKQNSFYTPGKALTKNESEARPEKSQAELYPGVIMSGSGEAFSNQLTKLPDVVRRSKYGSMFESSHGDLWYSEYNALNTDSLFQYNRVTKTTVSRYLGDSIGSLALAETEGKLFAVSEYAINRIEENGMTAVFRLPVSERFSGKTFHAFTAIEWEPGKIGIATQKLLVYDIGKNLLDTIKLPDTKDETVRTLWKYHDYIFIGTYGQGFFIYKKGTIKKMPMDKGGCLLYTHCFMEDKRGFCWISTNNGIFKVSIAALINAFEHDDKEVYYHHLGHTDGIKNTEFNGGCQPCALALSDGSLSFPSMNGFLKFHPDSVFTGVPSGKIYIEEIDADTVSLKTGSAFLNELPHSINKLSFKLNIPYWGNPENMYVSYQLSPRINEWQTLDIANNNVLSFLALPPGTYTLKLRVRNGYNNSEFNLSTIYFTILSPWYNTRLFYLFCLIAFLILTATIIKWRTAELVRREIELQQMVNMQTQEIQGQNSRLEGNNRINARLISIISHDMISPLKFVGFVAQNIKDEDSLNQRKNPAADSIITVSRELESLSGKILDWIKFHHHSYELKPEKFNLYQLIEQSIQIAFTLAKDKNLNFYNNVAKDIEVLQYKEAIGEIVNNLAMNSVKNTANGEINISYNCIDNFSLLTVSDTGKGISPDLVNRLNDQEHIAADYSNGDGKKYRFGHLIIKDLLQLMNGRLNVESALGEGTQVTIKFKDLEVL